MYQHKEPRKHTRLPAPPSSSTTPVAPVAMPALRIVRKTIRVLVVGGRLVIIIYSDVLHLLHATHPYKSLPLPSNIAMQSHRPTTRAPANQRAIRQPSRQFSLPSPRPCPGDPHPTQTRGAAVSAPKYGSSPRRKATTRVGRYAAKTPSHRMIHYNLSHSVKEILLFRMCSTSLMSILG